MGQEEYLQAIVDAILEADEDEAKDAVDEALMSQVSPSDILSKAITEAMNIVGEKWAAKEFYLPDVMASADTTSTAAAHLKDRLGDDEGESMGVVVIGTVKGDVHNVGKDLVATFMEASGFEVHNLGEDVPAEDFLEAVKEYAPDIVAMSCFATNVTPVMKEITDGLVALGVREQTHCMIGGIAMGPEWVSKVGADVYTKDAYEAAEDAKAFIGAKRSGTAA